MPAVGKEHQPTSEVVGQHLGEHQGLPGSPWAGAQLAGQGRRAVSGGEGVLLRTPLARWYVMTLARWYVMSLARWYVMTLARWYVMSLARWCVMSLAKWYVMSLAR